MNEGSFYRASRFLSLMQIKIEAFREAALSCTEMRGAGAGSEDCCKRGR
jgi:hypothetical protein